MKRNIRSNKQNQGLTRCHSNLNVFAEVHLV